MNKDERPQWSPYLAGSLTGVLIAVSALLSGNYFGASTSFVRSAGMLERLFMPGWVAEHAYFQWIVPRIDWQWMFVLGVFFGSLISALSSDTFRLQGLPQMWRDRFGGQPLPRMAAAFGGGALAMFGARLAGGCPSGHGLSGTLQLGISGYIALVCFFAGGLVMANILYAGGQKK